MRLLYLMTEPFSVGGVQSDMLALGPDLRARGHEVWLATAPGELLPELERHGVHFVPADFRFRGPLGLLRAARRLRAILRASSAEVVAPQSVRTTLVAWVACRLLPFSAANGRRIPIITTIHNIHNPVHFHYGGWLLRLACDQVIFESHYERNRLLRAGLPELRSQVIHSGIDTERFAPRVPDAALLGEYGLDKSRHTIFGIVARLSREKGHHLLLEAFHRVRQQVPGARLLVIGDGPLRGRLERQAARLGILDVVIFTGLKRNIPEHLSIMDVFVLSSTRESFPLAAREAMAAGRAVILPDIGGCPEVVEQDVTGMLFRAGDVEDLARAMTGICEGMRYVRMGKAARKRVERCFSRRQWVEGDEAVYLQALS